MHSISGASIHEIDGCGCRFGPIEIWHVLFMHNATCYLEYVRILWLLLLLECVLAREFSLCAFIFEVGDEFVEKVLLFSIRS